MATPHLHSLLIPFERGKGRMPIRLLMHLVHSHSCLLSAHHERGDEPACAFPSSQVSWPFHVLCWPCREHALNNYSSIRLRE